MFMYLFNMDHMLNIACERTLVNLERWSGSKRFCEFCCRVDELP